MTCKIDTHQFEISRGDPSKYFKGIRWFLIDDEILFQTYTHDWSNAKKQVHCKYPEARTIKLLLK